MQKENYTKIKQKALEFEKENLGYLQFVDSTNGFKQLFDNSALIFKSKIAPVIGYKTVNLRQDDLTAKPRAAHGVISFRNFENLRKKLVNIGAMEDEKTNYGRIIRFKLPSTYSKREIQDIIHDLGHQRQKFGQIISPKNPNPMLFVHLESLEKILYENLRQMHPFAQKTIGIEIFGTATKLLKSYLFYANASADGGQNYITNIQRGLRNIRYDLKTVENLGLIHAKNLERILEEIIIAERIVCRELKSAK